MPASPQDFALWSQMTGNPYPQSVAERVALAPQVYEFSKNIGKQNGPMGRVRGTIDTLGKVALAAGALAGAGYLVSKYGGGDGGGGGNPPPPPPGGGALSLDLSPDVPPTGPQGMGGFGSQVVRASQDITPPPTSDLYGQDVIHNQTSFVQEARGLSPQKPTQVPSEVKPTTQSAVIASRQTFAPGTEADMIGEDAVQKAIAFRNSKAYGVMQSQYPGLRDTDAEMLGGSETVSAPPVSSANVEVLGNSETVSAPQPKLADLFESQLREMAQSDARLYRSAGERIGSMRQILNEAGGTPQGASQESQPKIAPAVGPSPEEIRDLDKTLLLAHGANTNRIQRESMRNEMLAKKYSGQAESGPEYVGTGETVTSAAQSPSEVINPQVLPRGGPRKRKLSEQMGEDLNQLGQGLGAMTRTVDAMMQKQADSLARRSANLQAEIADLGEASNTAQSPAPKEFLHSAVEGVKQRAHLSKYGYDPKQKQAPGMEQVGPAHADLMADQMQRELGRQAEREAIYKRISPSPSADLSYLAKEGPGKFFNPASYVMR
jgi:hypothetical protein